MKKQLEMNRKATGCIFVQLCEWQIGNAKHIIYFTKGLKASKEVGLYLQHSLKLPSSLESQTSLSFWSVCQDPANLEAYNSI